MNELTTRCHASIEKTSKRIYDHKQTKDLHSAYNDLAKLLVCNN